MITAEITAAVDGAGTLRTFYAADAGFVTEPTDTPANTAFAASLTDPGSIAVTAFGDGRTGGATRLALGEMRLANVDGQYDGWLDFAFDGRPVVLRRGATAGAYPGSMQAVFTGTIEALTVTTKAVVVRLRDKQLIFDRKALPNTYAGSNIAGNGIEGGPDDIKGQSKPRLFGYGFYLPAPCVSPQKAVYQPNDGPLFSIDAVYVAGDALTNAGDYPDSPSLLAATLTPGPTFVTCLAEGLFRLAADPGGKSVRCDAVQGGTPDVRTAGQILKALALMAGLDPAEISTEDIAALDAANSSGIGLWITGDQTFTAAMDAVSGSVGAYYGFDGPGHLRMARLEAPVGSPVLEIAENKILGNFERRPASDGDIPTWSYTIRHSRIWSIDTDIAGSVPPGRRAYLANEYRAERAEDPLIRAKHLLATEGSADTLLVSGAAEEAARRLELHKVRRDFFDVVVPDEVLNGVALKIMDLVLLRARRFGLAGGRLFRVLGITPQLSKGRTTLTLWG
ncbi:MAG TPA: hypothetical protein VEA44_10625 [Caulobacter sp.]|nr:hypothetical protein [Caulobacter sp.]